MRTCSDGNVKELVKTPMEISAEDRENYPIIFSSNEEYQQAIQKTEKKYTLNFYTLSTCSLDNFFENFDFKDFIDSVSISLLGFTIILFLSILILFFSFKNNFKTVYLLSSANLLILFISTLILCLTKIIENINQIKIGYYLFVLNSIAILYFSKKLQKEKETQKE
jgi:hypothetical protein